jgi:hypothetical protein
LSGRFFKEKKKMSVRHGSALSIGQILASGESRRAEAVKGPLTNAIVLTEWNRAWSAEHKNVPNLVSWKKEKYNELGDIITVSCKFDGAEIPARVARRFCDRLRDLRIVRVDHKYSY